MEDYNFWKDFLDTYQSLTDWIKALWFIVPFAFALGLFALVLRHRVAMKEAGNGATGELVCAIRQDDFGQLHVYRYGPELECEPTLLLLDQPNSDLC